MHMPEPAQNSLYWHGYLFVLRVLFYWHSALILYVTDNISNILIYVGVRKLEQAANVCQ